MRLLSEHDREIVEKAREETRLEMLRERGWIPIESTLYPRHFYKVRCTFCGHVLRINQRGRQFHHMWKEHEKLGVI